MVCARRARQPCDQGGRASRLWEIGFSTDRQIEATAAQIAYLERKPNLTATELNQLNYLRDQLRRLRQVRDGK
jgi:hypothetical protein